MSEPQAIFLTVFFCRNYNTTDSRNKINLSRAKQRRKIYESCCLGLYLFRPVDVMRNPFFSV